MAPPEGLTSREVALAIIPHITGGLSMVGSAYIIVSVLRSKKKRGKSYHRLLAALSISDIISSFSYFLSTWPIPQVGSEGVAGWNKYGGSPYHYAAVGTQATCTAQGFGIQFGVMTTATYNVMLAIHYLLTIKWNYSETKLKTKVEPYMLSIPPIVGLALSLPEIFLKYFNSTNLWCWIKASWEYEDAVRRSYNARWAFAHGPMWAFIAFITIAQVYLWWTVRTIERRMLKFRAFDTVRQQTRHSRRVAQQAALYVGVFYVTNLPYTTIAATQRFYNPHTIGGFVALLAVVLFAPWQGFLNVFVYRRQQIVSATKDALARLPTRFGRNLSGSYSGRMSSNKRNTKNTEDNFDDNNKNISLEEAEGAEEQAEEPGIQAEESAKPAEESTKPANECEPFLPSHVSEVYED